MAKKIIKEVIVYFLILIILALFWHPDLLENPTERINNLLAGANRLSHPLEWSMVVYIIFGIVRLAFYSIKKLFCKKNSNKDNEVVEEKELS
jgi:uncharacterized integral membrane protein